MGHVLVTNDFPPKVGGIQSYLWELWRRLPSDRFAVLTTPYRGSAEFDSAQTFRISRLRSPVLLPGPGLAGRVREEMAAVGARLAVLDPALPLGLMGPSLRPARYAVVLHGAEVAVPASLPGSRSILGRLLRSASCLISAGHYPLAEARRAAGRDVAGVVVPPGVDVERFHPLSDDERHRARASFGLPVDGRIVLSVSRLVPRKGMDTLIAAAALLQRRCRDLTVAIAGGGRDLARLERLVAATGAPVRLLGRVPDDRLPGLVGSADVFTMLCRQRWGGLEQEGFGIVFLEAAACGVPQVAGHSGGAAEAVVHGETGLVVLEPQDPAPAAAAIGTLLDDPDLRRKQGEAARRRVEEHFSYDRLATVLDAALREVE